MVMVGLLTPVASESTRSPRLFVVQAGRHYDSFFTNRPGLVGHFAGPDVQHKAERLSPNRSNRAVHIIRRGIN